ncbi:FecR family protein [Sphingobacterium yanglingense]|uniref:FecR family protein n=1 Tax=Sphingobacterium yanglingense TaxID=1437280 RepID=A0A4R6WHP2_9SPHI|nr:FecR domain-containing protein [Sphingobacterium yanglingense]TDQ79713.1 FecR family protein [Sphingobacterium yanglingense]
MNKKELEILLDRYKSGQATAAEKQLLYRHYNDFIKHHNLDDFNESEAESRLSQWSPITKLEPSLRRLFPWRQVAAVFAITTFATLFYFRSIRQEDEAVAAASSEPIGAPVTKAIAILPSGDTLLLDGAQESAQKLASIHAKDLAISDQLITLKTPRGGKLHFTLPDGSSVWLNSETTMTYPATFGKESRAVTLQGEAYFEVVKIEQNNGKMPFTVRSEQEEVTVLGTKFNINNYKDEAISTTTLAEGAVAVRQLTESKSTLLKPNQQYISSASGTQVRKINASETVAWKEGIIALSNQDILSIIRMIERNYDVQFGSCVLPKEIRFSGELQTTLALDELLDVLEINLGLQFRRQGKTITILTNK